MPPDPAPDSRRLMAEALARLEAARARIETLEGDQRAPVAIVGMGCRFPGGASSPEAFWRLLREGRDASAEIPPDRWDPEAWHDADPATPGRSPVRRGSFVENFENFDAAFFGIAPAEASALDPQQRWLLETTWEALEDAAIDPQALRGSDTGVFAGISCPDWVSFGALNVPREDVSGHWGTGAAHSAAAGRLAYVLGLQGPCVAVDTACSSALAALHLAVRSLRLRECRVALVAGVNLILSPILHLVFAKARMLAADGRCKTFDAAADGYGRGEGCGVVVLKRLDDALRDRDPVRAKILSVAMNQDGPSAGLTVPNGPAQEAVIRCALEEAGVAPGDVGYVEAHGTGTSLGDPLEMNALAAVFGPGRERARSLLVGSVKTNVGHLEAAAGMAGLFKAVLQLEHREVAPHLHLRSPSPHISWDAIPISVPTRITAHPASSRGMIAGLSSFGFTGTNLHVVLAEAAAPREELPAESPEAEAGIVLLSAKTPAALRGLTMRLRDHLAAHPGTALADVVSTLALGRAVFRHRLAVVARSTDELRDRLGLWVADGDAAGVVAGEARVRPSDPFALVLGPPGDASGRGDGPVLRSKAIREVLDHAAAITGAEGAARNGSDDRVTAAVLQFAAVRDLLRAGLVPVRVLAHPAAIGAAALAAGVADELEALRLAIRAASEDMAQLPAAMAARAGEGLVIATGSTATARNGTLHVQSAIMVHAEDAVSGELVAVLGSDRVLDLTGEGIATTGDGIARAFVLGLPVDRKYFAADCRGRRVRLPTYPFERRRFAVPRGGGGLPGPPLLRTSWEPAPLPGGAPPVGAWVVAGDADPACSALAGELRARGLSHAAVAWSSAAGELTGVPDPVRGFVLVPPRLRAGQCRPDSPFSDLESVVDATIRLLGDIAEAHPEAEVVLVSRESQSAGGEDPAREPDLAGTALWGLCRSLAWERPQFRIRRIDDDGRAPEALAREIVEGEDDEVALRFGRRLLPRLRTASFLGHSGAGALVRPDASYLVTGGLGAFGREIAGWLAREGARHLILAGRTATPEAAGNLHPDVTSSGAEVRIRSCDVADAAAVQALVASIGSEGPPLKGVIHAAGVVHDAVLEDQDSAHLRAALAAKIAGAWNLHAATGFLDLDWFVGVSSAAAHLGAPGQTAYAAANAGLEAVCAFRRARALPALAIAFGPFDAGMAARSPEAIARFRRSGIRPLTLRAGTEALAALLRSGASAAVVLDAAWPRFAASLPPGVRVPVRLRELIPEASTATAPEGWLGAKLLAAGSGAAPGLIETFLREAAGAVLRVEPATLEADLPLVAQGLDSLGAMELRHRIAHALGQGPRTTGIVAASSLREIAAEIAASPAGDRAPDRRGDGVRGHA